MKALALVAAVTMPLLLHAQTAALPPPTNVVTLSASASVEVPKDLLNVVFSTTREGPEASGVQAQLRQALDAALAEARRAARPGALEVQTGNFSLSPRYAPRGGITGWQGTVELIVEGRDTQAVAQLVGRVQTLSVARSGFLLSREARERVEAEVAAEAITRFRARADGVARQFGFSGWTLREVQLSGSEPGAFQPVSQVRMRTLAVGAEEALPVEAGKATVSAQVSGSVQLQR